jgi:hypothetical protein
MENIAITANWRIIARRNAREEGIKTNPPMMYKDKPIGLKYM